MFSSKSNSWETPQDFFDKLNDEFQFTLDPCASHENHKCSKYYTIEDDGLSKDWSEETVFVNPPYGREISKWVKKCYEESLKLNIIVVMLLPARTDTKYQHDYIFKYAKAICFIKGRLKFGNQNNSAPFPSQIIIFSSQKIMIPNILNTYGKLIIL